VHGGAVREAVVHEPPVEPEKLVHVPLDGENVPLAGPFVIDQLRVVVWLYGTKPGLAERVQVGGSAGGEIFTVYVPLMV